MTETSRLVDAIDAKNQTLADVLAEARPATDTLAVHTSQIADLVVQVGDVSDQLRKFPSIAGTDSSGRSVIADANEVARAWNDVVLTPDATLYALNRLTAALGEIDHQQCHRRECQRRPSDPGSIPDIGFAGDPGLHGPKRYNWHQLVGSVQYTLYRLQERIVGKGPSVPQVPVIPNPAEPGQVMIAPPPPSAPPPPGILPWEQPPR